MPARPIAHQGRSAITEDRLCDAAEALLREGGLQACTIQDVAKRAKRAPASVYRRFGDKDRMIEAVFERYLARALEANEEKLKLLRARVPDLSGRLKAIVEGMIAGHRRDGRLVEALRETAARSSADLFSTAARRLREATLKLLGAALRECREEIVHPDKDRAIDITLGVLTGSVETLMRAPQPFSDRVLRDELHAMQFAYLTTK
jgi:AcrR family transcriptional regulator